MFEIGGANHDEEQFENSESTYILDDSYNESDSKLWDVSSEEFLQQHLIRFEIDRSKNS